MDVNLVITGQLESLKLEPGDLMVLTFPEPLTEGDARWIAERLKSDFPDQKVLILDGGKSLRLGVNPDTLTSDFSKRGRGVEALSEA